MKVLLINPWLTLRENVRLYPVEPLGLLYLATYSNKKIKENKIDIEIKILDTQLEGEGEPIKVKSGFRSGMNNESFKHFLNAWRPEVVGITNKFTTHTNDILEIAEIVKELFPRSTVIVGGVNATLAHRELINNPNIDIVVRNEGEDTFWQILDCIYTKKPFYNIVGTTAKNEKGEPIINSNRAFINNLDEIPIPDRGLINYERYINNNRLYFTTKNNPIGTIISSRGCVFDCVFCSTKAMWQQKWRARSPKNVVDEIEYLTNTYKVREIAFQDDQFLFDNQRVIDICQELRRRKIKISFIVPSGITPSLLKKDTIDEMTSSGFYRVALSIDSGTEKSRSIVNKPLLLKEMRSLVKYLNKKGLWTYATFVIGFPEETKEDIQVAIDFAYSLKVDFLRFYIAQPYPGSRLYDIYIKRGFIKESRMEELWDNSSIYDTARGTDFVSGEELVQLRKSAEKAYLKIKFMEMFNLKYVFREFIPKINSWGKFNYFLRLLGQLGQLDKARGFTFE